MYGGQISKLEAPLGAVTFIEPAFIIPFKPALGGLEKGGDIFFSINVTTPNGVSALRV